MAGNPDEKEPEGAEPMTSMRDIVRELHTPTMPDDDRILLAEDRMTGERFSLAAIGGGGYVVQQCEFGSRATWHSTAHIGHDQRTAIDAWLIATDPPVARRLWWFSELAVRAWRTLHAANRASVAESE